VVDGLKRFLQSAMRPERISLFFDALVGELHHMQVTTIYTEEIPLFSREIAPSAFSMSTLAENIVLVRHFQHEATMRRTVAVIKQCESGHDHGVREFWIEDHGVRVAPDNGSAQVFLAGR
jgi:circadian clock protein KaiC